MKYLFITVLIFMAGCAGDKATDTGGTVPTINNLSISGVVQNGPYRQFTQGTIQGLDATFNQVIGETATAETSDAIGAYASQITFATSVYAKIIFTGQHFVENTGAYSGTDLTTSSYVFGLTDSNVNLVTYIIQDDFVSRINAGRTKAQAILESTAKFVLDATGEVVTTGANTWLITDNSPLLFLSLLLQHGVSGQSLQLVINDMRADFADGTLSQTSKDLFTNNAKLLQASSIYESNVLNGLGIAVQPITTRLSTLDPSRLITSKHVQGTGSVTYSSTAGSPVIVLVPFSISAATQINYIGLDCAVSGISIHSSDGSITTVRDANLNPVLTISFGTLLASATYAPNTIPLRDYGNGVIGAHQATLATPLDLAVGEYWARVTVDAGCVLATYEPVASQYVVMENAVPDWFVYNGGLNTLHLELL